MKVFDQLLFLFHSLLRASKPLLAGTLFLFIHSNLISATFTVLNTNDAGPGSLRQAIVDANNAPGHDDIVFDPALGATPTINVTNQFADITESVEILGNTATGGMVNIIGGNGQGFSINIPTNIAAPMQTIIRNLTISGFANRGINVTSVRNLLIAGCRIGSEVAPNQLALFVQNSFDVTLGTPTEPNDFSNNADEAVLFENVENINIVNYSAYYVAKGLDFLQCSGITIADVRIGACRAEGIHLRRSSSVSIVSSIVGLTPTGDFPTPLGANTGFTIGDGIKVEGTTDVTIGGAGALRNVIGRTKNGIWVGGADNPLGGAPRIVSDRVNLIGNYIGTDLTGTVARANTDHQVRIDDAQNVTVGGATENEGNLIAGAPGFYGIHIESQPWWSTLGTSGVLIQNNRIGLNINGDALPNLSGILIADPINMGRLAPVTVLNNVIAGNVESGVEIRNSLLPHVVRGNSIGVNGGAIRPNGGSGVLLLGASNNLIGGLGAGEENIISNNSGDGIELTAFSGGLFSTNNEIIGNTIQENARNGVFINEALSNNNRISQNSFNCNTTKAINLNNTPAQGLGNNNKVTPTIISSSSVGNLYGTASSGDVIEVFERGTCQTNGTCSAANYQMQGRVFVGTATANGAGEWSFAAPLSPENYTVSATSPSGNTSEFAICSCTDPMFTISKTDPTTCSGTDGVITISPSGVNPLDPLATYTLSYTFNSVAVTPFLITTNASSQFEITGLSSGSYANFSLSTFSCSSSIPNELVLSDPTTPVINTTSTNPSICNGTDGSISINGLVASTSYTINYSFNSIPVASFTQNATGNTITVPNLVSGAYTGISVTTNGCVSNLESETITDPDSPSITTSFEEPGCENNDGSITINGLLASTSYEVNYLFNSTPEPTITRVSTGNSIVLDALSGGVYSDISVTLGGCTSNLSTETLTAPAVPVISVSSTNPSSCGLTDGFVTISGLNPSTNYEINYVVNASPVTLDVVSTPASDFEITGLGANNYTNLRVIESGCVSNNLDISLSDPDAPVINTSSINPSACSVADGSITISGLDASTNFELTYLVDNQLPGVTTSISTDASGEFLLNTLVEGNYSEIRVRSTLGCLSNSQSEILSEPLSPTFSTQSFNISSCTTDDGRITLNPSGINPIVPNESYLLSYLQNGNLVNLNPTSDPSGTISLTNLDDGIYSNFLLSLDNCETEDLGPYQISKPQIDGGTARLSSNEICHDEFANLTLNGTTGSSIIWQDSIAGRPWSNFGDTLGSNQSGVTIQNRTSSDSLYFFRAFVFDSRGCEAFSDVASLKVDTCPVIFVPEGISINNDGQNDLWEILGLESYDNYEIKVFNRWGTVVYETVAPYDVPWDGRRNGQELPVATYYWYIEIIDTEEKFAGPLTLVR